MTLKQLDDEITAAIECYKEETDKNGGRDGTTAAYAELVRVKTLLDIRSRYFGRGFDTKYDGYRKQFILL